MGSSCLSRLTLARALYPAESCLAAVAKPRAVRRSAEPKSNRSDLDESRRHSDSLAPLRVAATRGIVPRDALRDHRLEHPGRRARELVNVVESPARHVRAERLRRQGGEAQQPSQPAAPAAR